MKRTVVVLAPYYTEQHNAAMSKLVKNLNGVTVLGTIVEDERGIVHSIECDKTAFEILKTLSDADCLWVEDE